MRIITLDGYFISFVVSNLVRITRCEHFDFCLWIDFAGIVPIVRDIKEVLRCKLFVVLDRICRRVFYNSFFLFVFAMVVHVEIELGNLSFGEVSKWKSKSKRNTERASTKKRISDCNNFINLSVWRAALWYDRIIQSHWHLIRKVVKIKLINRFDSYELSLILNKNINNFNRNRWFFGLFLSINTCSVLYCWAGLWWNVLFRRLWLTSLIFKWLKRSSRKNPKLPLSVHILTTITPCLFSALSHRPSTCRKPTESPYWMNCSQCVKTKYHIKQIQTRA